MRPVLVVHAGAGSLPGEEDRRQYLQGVREALGRGRPLLAESARAAVLAAVVHLESHSIANAGRGAALAADGSVALDAGFMDGRTRRYGGVTGVRTFENPVLLAAHLSGEGDFGRFLGPPDSDRVVADVGGTPCRNEHLVTERARRLHGERKAAARPTDGSPWMDTVGAVALDVHGRLAAAVSTGGMSMKRSGRIGDSPVVGAGYWADDRRGAAVTTGVGEALMRQGTARRCVQLVEAGWSPREAAAAALAELLDFPGDTRGASGIILVTAGGDVAVDHNSAEMSAGIADLDGREEIGHLWRAR